MALQTEHYSHLIDLLSKSSKEDLQAIELEISYNYLLLEWREVIGASQLDFKDDLILQNILNSDEIDEFIY